MDQLQQILVSDHIHDLEHLAAALRAERERDARATPLAAPRRAGDGPRRRLGAWLIGIGEAIAGRSPDVVGDCGDPMASPV